MNIGESFEVLKMIRNSIFIHDISAEPFKIISTKDIWNCAVGLNTALLQISFLTMISLKLLVLNFCWEFKNMSIYSCFANTCVPPETPKTGILFFWVHENVVTLLFEFIGFMGFKKTVLISRWKSFYQFDKHCIVPKNIYSYFWELSFKNLLIFLASMLHFPKW